MALNDLIRVLGHFWAKTIFEYFTLGSGNDWDLEIFQEFFKKIQKKLILEKS